MKFLCGTYFKHQCAIQLSHYTDARTPEFFTVEEDSLDNNFVFCKPEHLSTLSTHSKIGSVRLPKTFNLVTHNSDINFSENEISFILNLFPNIEHWYTQNLVTDHPQVSPIPIGIANPRWSHGNQERFSKIQGQDLKKNNEVYVNFNISTNPTARSYCYQQISDYTSFSLEKNYPNASSISDHDEFVNSTQEKYLKDIAQSYFTVSPVGNGVDCHKTWESLYMKSIPPFPRWRGVEKFKEMGIPLLIIDDWSEFKNLDLSASLYHDLWKDFNTESLNFNFFKK
jgi:hypothetical protein